MNTVKHKYIKYKNKYLKLKNMIGGDLLEEKKEDIEDIEQHDPALIAYLLYQTYILSSILHSLDHLNDPLKKMLVNIPNGGSFTNKLDTEGKLLASLSEEEKMNLSDNIGLFESLATNLSNTIETDETYTIYRSINIGNKTCDEIKHADNNFIHPIPFSCSWTIDLALELWQKDKCCILEIELPYNYPFITFSNLQKNCYSGDVLNKYTKYISEDKIINDLNTTLEGSIITPTTTLEYISFEDQLELLLVPSKFIFNSCRMINNNGKDVLVVNVSPIQIKYVEDNKTNEEAFDLLWGKDEEEILWEDIEEDNKEDDGGWV